MTQQMQKNQQSKQEKNRDTSKKQETVEAFINIFEVAGLDQQKLQKDKKAHKQLRPEPLADPKLTKKICQLLQQLLPMKQVRKGVNEILKEMAKGTVEIVIMAVDCDPLEIIMTLPPLCEQKNVQYCFISSKAVLGRACGIKRPIAAAGIVQKEGSQLTSQILQLKDKIQQLQI